MSKSPPTPPADPFAFLSQMVSQFEKQMNAASNKAMENEETARALARFSNVSAGASRAFETMMENYLAAIKMPSRGQIADILERLIAIEAKLEDLHSAAGASQLDRYRAPEETRRPTRGRQPASAAAPQAKAVSEAEKPAKPAPAKPAPDKSQEPS